MYLIPQTERWLSTSPNGLALMDPNRACEHGESYSSPQRGSFAKATEKQPQNQIQAIEFSSLGSSNTGYDPLLLWLQLTTSQSPDRGPEKLPCLAQDSVPSQAQPNLNSYGSDITALAGSEVNNTPSVYFTTYPSPFSFAQHSSLPTFDIYNDDPPHADLFRLPSSMSSIWSLPDLYENTKPMEASLQGQPQEDCIGPAEEFMCAFNELVAPTATPNHLNLLSRDKDQQERSCGPLMTGSTIIAHDPPKFTTPQEPGLFLEKRSQNSQDIRVSSGRTESSAPSVGGYKERHHLNYRPLEPYPRAGNTGAPERGPHPLGIVFPSLSSAYPLEVTGAENAFKDGSFHPNPALRRLLEQVLVADFIRLNTMEPCLNDDYSVIALSNVAKMVGCPLVIGKALQYSLFTLFLKRPGNICLLCGKSTTCLNRALGCVRAHLQHRPFKCTGCSLCSSVSGYAQFSTLAHLKDHVVRQTVKQKCTLCQATIRIGGMYRHWQSMHPGKAFKSKSSSHFRGIFEDLQPRSTRALK